MVSHHGCVTLCHMPPTAADRVLDAAVDRITRDGLTVGLDDVRMEEAIAQAGVSRATAYRRWPSRDDFAADVLVQVVRRTTLVPEGEGDVARLVRLVADAAPSLGDAQARRDLVVEALRVSVDADIRRMLASPGFRTYLSVSATFPGLPPGRVRDAVEEALARTDADFVARRAAVYANLARMIGYRPVEDDGLHLLATTSGSLMTGILLRAMARPAWLDERTSRRAFGASREADWSEAERLLVGCFLGHLEPDPAITWDDVAVAERFALMRATIADLYAQPSQPLDG